MLQRREATEKTAKMGEMILGEGAPKICVPIMGKNASDIAAAAARAYAAGADLIELRADSLAAMPEEAAAEAAMRAARENAPGLPLLFTLRTARDGGPGSDDLAAYEKLLRFAAQSGLCEAIDCELSAGEDTFTAVAACAHEAGVCVVGSSHEFGEIGDMTRTEKWLKKQEALGADICKAAVMVRSRTEALQAALCMARAGEEIAKPMIAIAMGAQGVLTRICAECIGSCLTFATAGKASAPGQMDATQLRGVIECIHEASRQA